MRLVKNIKRKRRSIPRALQQYLWPCEALVEISIIALWTWTTANLWTNIEKIMESNAIVDSALQVVVKFGSELKVFNGLQRDTSGEDIIHLCRRHMKKKIPENVKIKSRNPVCYLERNDTLEKARLDGQVSLEISLGIAGGMRGFRCFGCLNPNVGSDAEAEHQQIHTLNCDAGFPFQVFYLVISLNSLRLAVHDEARAIPANSGAPGVNLRQDDQCRGDHLEVVAAAPTSVQASSPTPAPVGGGDRIRNKPGANLRQDAQSPDIISNEVDCRGVTVSFLRTFVEDHKDILKDMSTSDVCKDIIKPTTKRESMSYVELLQRNGKTSLVGKAKRFVSHAWSYKFLSVVETIFQKCKVEGLDESNCIIWFDIFSVNQHSGIEQFHHWATSFKQAILSIGAAWIIFIPFFAIWLERAWCLFELFAMVECGVPFEILLPSSEQLCFAEYLLSGGKVEDAISKIDVRKAKAFKQSDLDNINALVTASMGHGKLNDLVCTEMRKWFVSSAESVLNSMSSNDERLTSELLLNTVKMYITLGRLADADTELANRLEKQRLLLSGAESFKTAETLCEVGTVKWKLGQLERALSVLTEARLIYQNLKLEDLELLGNITNRTGAILADLGKYDDALQSYIESLDAKSRCFGTGHVSVAATEKNIGIVLAQKGDNENALLRFRKALEIEEKCLGRDHASVAATESNIGNVKSALGDYEGALVHLKRALEIDLKTVGSSHVKVAETYGNIGNVHQALGDYENALVHYKKALDIFERALGSSHVSVAATYGNIGNVLGSQGKLEEALEMHQKCLEIKEKCLGSDHASVAGTYVNMGTCLVKMGRYEDARDVYHKSLEINRKCLGEDHTSTADSKWGLADVLSSLGEPQKALELYEEVLDTQVRCLGTGHVSVADTKNNIAIVYGRLGNQDKRLELNREAHSIYLRALGPDHPKTKGIAPFI